MQELVINTEYWAEEKGLIDVKLAPKQYLKALEEIGETARAILKNDKEQIVDGIGDICVTVIILAKQLSNKINMDINLNNKTDKNPFVTSIIFKQILTSFSLGWVDEDILSNIANLATNQGFTLEFCLQSAWNEIKDRKGKLINGTFVKES
jgi:hypothetical protein